MSARRPRKARHSPRRKAGRAAAAKMARAITFSLTVDAQQMRVRYQPNYFADTGHFEFRSPHKPPRRIPISQTGYRSHFASMEDIEAAQSPQEYARMVALALLFGEKGASVRKESRQLSLF